MNANKRLVKIKNQKIKATKIQAKPLTDKQIQEFVSFYEKRGSFPGSKIPCVVTGKLTTCVGPWLKKKIKEFGGAERLLKNYKCRGALKAERQIIKPVTKRTKRKNKLDIIRDEQKNWDLPKINFDPPRVLSSSEIAQTTSSQCLRPDVFLNNGRHCEGCEHYELCTNRLKTLPLWDKKTKKQKTAVANY